MRCKATKRDGTQCKAAPIHGGAVCRMHGGGAPAVKAAAARRAAEAKAAAEMESALVTLGLPVDIDPARALLNEVAVTYGHVQWLRGKVQELSPGELVWGMTQTDNGVGPQGPVDMTTEKAASSVWYQLYMQEREHLAKVSSMALRAGIEERRVKLAEDQGNLVAAVIDRILSAILGWLSTSLPPEAVEQVQGTWVAMVHDVVPRELRALAALD